ncbi:hypothetical protein F7P75_10045 [Acinetobacter gandensis]|uniref:Uncharacterized protein n=1 Tax=Acinetobacter gandensis TaxID=1443941 RepID=A0A1A7RB76_9GAMM|nr:hypothetical protein [Acinetobacter gandensis]KAB0625902.1 hypothetical protein F7P75_10045 [Acinetobacter gandensis]OBX27957.1 hypothetical protein A9J31_07470 [Acinetobacter gandensis]
MFKLKEEIIETLENCNQKTEIKKLIEIDSDFAELDLDYGELISTHTLYNENDFYGSLDLLKRNFSKERLDSVIGIKLWLIDHEIQGFVDVVQNETIDIEENFINTNANLEESVDQLNLKQKENKFSNNLFDHAFSSKDLDKIKAILLNLIIDREVSTLKLTEYGKVLHEKIPEIFEVYKEDIFNEKMKIDQDKWDSQYLQDQHLSLQTNFSLDRYNHVLEVRKFLGINNDGFLNNPNPNPNVESDNVTDDKNPNRDDSGKSIIEELLDKIVDGLNKLKDVGCNLIEKIKAKFK